MIIRYATKRDMYSRRKMLIVDYTRKEFSTTGAKMCYYDDDIVEIKAKDMHIIKLLVKGEKYKELPEMY